MPENPAERDNRGRLAPTAISDPKKSLSVPEEVVPFEKRHAAMAAQLHRTGIETGFLSSLGVAFLRHLYKTIPSCRGGFGFVCEKSSGEVLGMICCAESTGRLYKECLQRRGLLMALTLVKYLFRPSVIYRMIETLRYPSQVEKGLPSAEVLSIVVSEKARGKGIGKALMKAALDEFRKRGIDRVKVAVGDKNETAKAFYRRCGYDLRAERTHHGLGMSIFVISLPTATP